MQRLVFLLLWIAIACSIAYGQIYAEKFGKNRLQFEPQSWHYIKTNYFDVYYTDSTDQLAKYVAVMAEEELPAVENEVGYSLRQRAEIVLYTNYSSYLNANLGRSFFWQTSDDVTRVVNAVIPIYYDGFQSRLAVKVREGLINFLLHKYVYKDMRGNKEADQYLQSIPAWVYVGYTAYKAENWSTVLDDRLRNLFSRSAYNSFDQFYYRQPVLAAHAFWYYIERKYGKESPSYLMHFIEASQNLKRAFKILFNKKVKEIKGEMMTYFEEKYLDEEEQREQSPDGEQLFYEEESPIARYYNFIVHPEEDNNSFSYVEYYKGITSVVFMDDYGDEYDIVKIGIPSKKSLYFKQLPVMAWNNEGTEIAIAYPYQQKVRLQLYNTDNRYKGRSFILEDVDEVQSIKYDFQDNKLILSAFRFGQSDIYIYHLDQKKLYQITNDPYDNIDASPLLFSNKTSIIYSSNRPVSGTSEDDASKIYIPSRQYNVCIVDDWLEGGFRTINKITSMERGNARFPVQYNSHYFTFLSDNNGIYNRYLGRVYNRRVRTKRLTVINGESYVDLPAAEEEKLLQIAKQQQPDTSYSIGATEDSSSYFPITNYVSSLYESKTTGINRKITEVYYDGEYKTLYSVDPEESVSDLRLSDRLLKSDYMSNEDQLEYSPVKIPTTYNIFPDTVGEALFALPTFSPPLRRDLGSDRYNFRSSLYSFEEMLNNTFVYKYRLRRYRVAGSVGFNTGLFTDRLQPYGGGSGPIFSALGSSLGLNANTVIKDVAEEYEFYVGLNFGLGGGSSGLTFTSILGMFEVSVGFNNFRRRIDWGVGYRLTQREMADQFSDYAQRAPSFIVPMKLLTHYYSVNLSYPFDAMRSLRLHTQIRAENYVYLSNSPYVHTTRDYPTTDKQRHTLITRLEWVYDNAYKTTINTYEGWRYKIYLDWLLPVQDNTSFAASGNVDPNIINLGADVRYYYPVYKEMTIAARLGIDMSFGDRRIMYYVGGADAWFLPSFNAQLRPNSAYNYSYQSLAVNLRGFQQNADNGSSAMVLNVELRVPASTFTKRYINSLFLRNMQLIVFTDMGTAWNEFDNINRPRYEYSGDPIDATQIIGGIGPFIGGFGAGLRLKFLGQYMKFDIAWNYDSFFTESPIFYFGLGFDF